MANKSYHHLYNTKRWYRRRHYQLKDNPFCSMCLQQGIYTPAKIADHIEAHRGDEELFYNGRLQSLCKMHHDSTKQRQEKSGIIVGGDESGNPIDPSHHWNKGRG